MGPKNLVLSLGFFFFESFLIFAGSRCISLEGAVYNPGIYFIQDQEGLKELFDTYGGSLTVRADLSKIYVFRQKLEAQTQVICLNGYLAESWEWKLENFDRVQVKELERPFWFLPLPLNSRKAGQKDDPKFNRPIKTKRLPSLTQLIILMTICISLWIILIAKSTGTMNLNERFTLQRHPGSSR